MAKMDIKSMEWLKISVTENYGDPRAVKVLSKEQKPILIQSV